MRQGEGYLGTSKVETSISMDEIIPESPEAWTSGYNLRKFSFYNVDACTVKINKNIDIYLRARQGFEVGYNDKPITSFIILEDNIKYNWIGSY